MIKIFKTKIKFSLKKLDLLLLFLLFSLILLYQLQNILPLISKLKIREIIFIYLYIRLIFFYKKKINLIFFLLIIFLGLSLVIGILTYIYYGSAMSVSGFLRFVNVALLAPLFSVFITKKKQLKKLMCIWITILILSFFSVVYQLFGGDLSNVFNEYYVTRAGLPRYKSLLGEPNISGMSAVFAFIYSFYYIKSFLLKYIIYLISLFLVIFSLSKAALIGLVIALFIITVFKLDYVFNNKIFKFNFNKNNFIIVISFVLLFSIIFISFYDTIFEYALGLINYIFNDNYEKTPNVFIDIYNRLILRTINSIELFFDNIFDFLIGNSFGVAGSVAIEIGDENAVLPHNSFTEIFLVGGISLLLVFFSILISSFYKLFVINKHSSNNNLIKFIIISFFILILYATGYPIIYHPILGSLFWLIVGATANKNLMNSLII